MSIVAIITNAAGQPIGDGPIHDVAGYSRTARLSRAGDMALDIPASHPRAALIGRFTRLNADVDYLGGKARAGTCIVDRIDTGAGADALLSASGSDLLGELNYTVAKGLLIHEIGTSPASLFEIVEPGGSAATIPAATDNDPATAHTATYGPTAWLYVSRPYPFHRLEFDITAGTAGNDEGLWQGFVEGDGWVSLDILTDTTNGLTQSGYIEWLPPAGETQAAHNGGIMFGVRLIWTDPYAVGMTNTISEVRATGIQPTKQGFQQVLALAGGWALSADHLQETTEAVVIDCANQSLLWCLVEIEKRTGDRWRLAAGGAKEIDLLGTTVQRSGVTAVGWLGSEAHGNPDVCQITSLRQMEDATGTVTRIYPFGAGSGAGRLTIAAATLQMPAGYAMNRDEGYIERVLPTGEQRIEGEIVFREIEPVAGALPEKDEIAANQLALAALNHLRLHDGSTEYIALDLEITGTHAPLEVGDSIRVIWRGAGLRLDSHLIILEVAEGSPAGYAVPTRITVANLPRYPKNDRDLLADRIAQLSHSSSTAQPPPKNALQRQLRGGDIVTQIVTSAGGRPAADPTESVEIAAALEALGLINIR